MTDTSGSQSNTSVTISNRSQYDLNIFDVFLPTDTGSGSLVYTRLGSTIKSGQTQTVTAIRGVSTWHATYTGQMSALGNKFYRDFPVAAMLIMDPLVQINSRNPAFAGDVGTEVIINDDDLTGMVQTFQFVQFTSANPASKLAKDLDAILGASAQQNKKLDEFFADTESFSKATGSGWNAVVAWQELFLSPWQGTYYIYNTASKAPLRAMAMVTISSSQQGDQALLSMGASDPSASSTSQAQSLSMNGKGHLVPASGGGGNTSADLQPIWMNSTQDGTDSKLTNAIASALSGTVNGANVVGTLTKQGSLGGDSGTSTILDTPAYRYTDAALNKVSNLAGLLVGVASLYVMYKQLRMSHNQQLAEANGRPEGIAKADDTFKSDIKSVSGSADRITSGSSSAPALESGYALDVRKANISSVIAKNKQTLDDFTVQNGAPTPEVEKSYGHLSEAERLLNTGDLEGAANELQTLNVKLSSYSGLQSGEGSSFGDSETLSKVEASLSEFGLQEANSARLEKQKQQEDSDEDRVTDDDPISVEGD